jgi:hypothetical protein
VNFEGANHIQMIAQLEARKIGYMPINWTIYVAWRKARTSPSSTPALFVICHWTSPPSNLRW